MNNISINIQQFMTLFLTHCSCAAVFKIGFLHASILKVLDDKIQ